VKLVIDAQLPPSLAEALRRVGCDAVAVREIGLRDAKDAAIWQYALQNNAAILTKDEDFAGLGRPQLKYSVNSRSITCND